MSEKKPISRQLTLRMVVWIGAGVPMIGAIFFLPAGTFNYWQAWVYLAIIFTPMIPILIYFLKNAPELLERRLRTRESDPAQKLIITLSLIPFLAAFLLPGFDHRYSWSHVPVWGSILAAIAVLVSYGFYFLVMKENHFAARTVEVEQEQKVISTGPYALVRHPMYTSLGLMYLSTPLALGSYWAVIPSASILIILVARILSEEKILERDLPGYTEYKQKTRYRLIPGIW